MDDFRKRYDAPRRDYSVPQSQPTQPPAPSRQIPINSEPTQQPQASQPTQPQVPAYQPPAQADPPQYQPAQSQPESQSGYLSPQAQTPAPAYTRPVAPDPQELAAQEQAKPKSKLNLKIAAPAAVLILLLIGGGFFMFKPQKTKAVTPADLAKKATFTVYYPSSLPTGYTYSADLATYDNGGAYYTVVNGPKHIILRENVNSSGKLETNEVTNPQPLDTKVGKAVIGTNTGQTAAAILAGNTYVFVYSNGSVSQDDITAVVNKLSPLNK